MGKNIHDLKMELSNCLEDIRDYTEDISCNHIVINIREQDNEELGSKLKKANKKSQKLMQKIFKEETK